MITKTIITIKNYPDNGNHLECLTGLPFTIRKGEDGYYFIEKGKERKYNMGKKLTKKWIAHLKESANPSLVKIYKVKQELDLDKLVEYCRKMYVRSLKMEINRYDVP